jgi:hypothetical protein
MVMERLTVFRSRVLFWLLMPWVGGGLLFFPYLAYSAILARQTSGFVLALLLFLLCLFVTLAAVLPRQSRGQRLRSAEAQKPKAGITESEPTVCLSCGALIPAGRSGCPKCGWTYIDWR